MCFIVSIVLFVLSYNFFISQNILLALASFLAALFFVRLMIKNILFVRNLKNKKREDSDN